MKNTLRLIITVTCVLFSFTANAAQPGDSIVLATQTDPKTFNPITSTDSYSSQIMGLVLEGLVDLEYPSGEIVSNLASRWEHDEAGLVWTFYLRSDVVWSDGTPFTSKDVVFTFNDLIYNPDVYTSTRSILTIDGKPIEVKAINEYEVQFRLPSPFAPFLRAMTQSILPAHKLSSAVREKKFNEAWSVDVDLSEVVGTGPFLLDRYRSGEKIILKRNPHYFRKGPNGETLPYLERFIYIIVPNNEVALLKFKNGELDVYGVGGSDYPWLKPLEEKIGFKIFETGPTTSTTFIVFNLNQGVSPATGKPFVHPVKQKWFSNVAFRRAVAHCLSREDMAQIILNGFGVPQHSPMSPASGYFFNDEVNHYDYDLEKAKTLLHSEGFVDRDGDGWVEDKEGSQVQFNLLTNAGNNDSVLFASLIRKDLREIGIEVNLHLVEFNTLVAKLTGTKEWDTILLGLTGGEEPHFGANVWLSSGNLHLWNPQQAEPATEWERRIDEIFKEAVGERDRTRRKELYNEWQEIIARELPLIYTVIPEKMIAVKNTLKNLKPHSIGGVLHNIEELYKDHA